MHLATLASVSVRAIVAVYAASDMCFVVVVVVVLVGGGVCF